MKSHSDAPIRNRICMQRSFAAAVTQTRTGLVPEALWVLQARFITTGAPLMMRPFSGGPRSAPLISAKHLP